MMKNVIVLFALFFPFFINAQVVEEVVSDPVSDAVGSLLGETWGDNIMTNSGFENWTVANPPYWTRSVAGGSNITKETTTIHGGVNSCNWSVVSGATCTMTQDETAFSETPATGASAKLTFWYYASATNFYIYFNMGASTLYIFPSAANVWIKYEWEFTWQASDVRCRFLKYSSGTYNVFFDDLSLQLK